MSKFVGDVREFHHVFGIEIGQELGFQSTESAILRLNLIAEEFKEVLDEFESQDIEKLAQELVDLVYVTVGAAITFGIPFDRVWDEVHRANMEKVGGGMREDGKVLKPEGWVPPNIKGALGLNAG